MIRMGTGERIMIGGFYLIVGLFSVLCVIPFLLVLSSSFTPEGVLLREGYKLIPTRLSLEAYRVLLQGETIYRAYGVTVFITVVGTVLSLLVTSGVAYTLSVRTVRYRNHLLFFIFFTMLFQGGLVPTYIVISKYLHLSNNIWVMILPALVNQWLMFLLRNFFMSIPDTLAESAKIDGANDIYILFRIILPLSLPALATIGLFYALDYWNEWFRAILFIDDKNLYPLQSIIINIISSMNFAKLMAAQGVAQSIPAYGIRMATVVLTIGPIVFLYPFLQKYFIQGLTIGAVKG